MNRFARSKAKSVAAKSAGTGVSTSPPSNTALRHGLGVGNSHPGGEGISDADFDRLLGGWDEEVEVLIRLKGSGFTLRLGDKQTVVAMLEAERDRRRALREATR